MGGSRSPPDHGGHFCSADHREENLTRSLPGGTASLGILPVSGWGLFVLASFSPARYRPRMAKDTFTLSDVLEQTLTVVCQPCGRRRRYNVQRLMAKHGNAKILYLLAELTNCPKAQSTNIYDRCKARYEGLTSR
jgi:hypothetical protein